MVAPDATTYLRALARRVVDSYLAHDEPRAALLVGSAATGAADLYSDLDLIVYYDRVPPPEAVAETPRELGAEWYRSRPWSDDSGEADAQGYGERYGIGGVECQVALISVGAVERRTARIVGDLELSEESLKILSGLHEGLPLHGAALIGDWRRTSAMTDELQRALIEKRWRLFPWWYFQERLRTRDATAWRHDVLAQSVYNLVGTLAALNRIYFSTFEFKRASAFIERLEVAPHDFAERLESLFTADERRSTEELEWLVAETRALVSERLPDLDLGLEWGGTPTPPGAREVPWAHPHETSPGSRSMEFGIQKSG
jgi:predicted nucleotidyltransferase